VLFLFVVMMLDVDVAKMREGYVRYLPVGLLVAVIMLVEMLLLIGIRSRIGTPFGDNAAMAVGSGDVPNTLWLARALFTDFLLPFEVAAVILTIAVIAAVMLTLRRRAGAKHQNPAAQSRVRPRDRLRMVKMATVRPTLPAVPTEEPKP
jgi:NADH-quinone oxidoreductase subunit J